MRYLGNKTKLLPAIETFLSDRGLKPPGVFFDAFSGSGVVARRMKQLGWSVVANDLLVCAAVQATTAIGFEEPPKLQRVLLRRDVRKFLNSAAGRAAIDATPPPAEATTLVRGKLRTMRGAYLPLSIAIAFLNHVPPVEGFVFRQYCPEGVAPRRYFTPEVARRIDGVRTTLATWRREGAITAEELAIFMASLLEAADRCANIAGTYGAYLKGWSPHSARPLALRNPWIVPGPSGRVFRDDANELASRIDCDVLYIDPPYNHRQFSSFYHVMEVIAELGFRDDEAEYERFLTGKTGLAIEPLEARRSRYCETRPQGGVSPAERALAELVTETRAEHLVMSYNEEGLISRDALQRVFERVCPGFALEKNLVEVSHKRFRSDGDKPKRRYRTVEGRRRNEVKEWLIYARKPRPRVTDRGQLTFAWAADELRSEREERSR